MEIEAIRELIDDQFGTADLSRVYDCLDILAGRKRTPLLHDDQEATRILFPGLTAAPWHDHSSWLWAIELQRHWQTVLAEFEGVRHRGETFNPYEDQYTQDLGWTGWQTWHVYRQGRFTDNASIQCPTTVASVAASPHGVRESMFSVLSPGTHLKPHTGGVNLFLTVHLPLVVPPDCGLRVGDETRVWVPGQLLVFDDSFIHEAWNWSDRDRAVLLWDIWHPDLTRQEIEVLTWLAPRLQDYLKAH